MKWQHNTECAPRFGQGQRRNRLANLSKARGNKTSGRRSRELPPKRSLSLGCCGVSLVSLEGMPYARTGRAAGERSCRDVCIARLASESCGQGRDESVSKPLEISANTLR